jgi:hypothetical protein
MIMKKIFLLFAILFATNTYGTQYVPLVKEDVEWQILYTSYPYEFQMAKSMTRQIYTLYGDTIIANLTYKKICLKTNIDEQPKYIYFGAIREQDKRIYYIGNGYITTSSNYNVNAAKIKAMKDCLTSYNYDSQEVLLYDFNSKSGDYVEWGYRYRQIIYEDSVLVGNSYRRCLHMSDNDKIVEGIGSVMNGMLSSVTPMTTCSNYFQGWEFDAFMTNGAILYKSTKNSQSIGYQTVYSQRKAYYKTDNNNTETLKMDSCVFFNDSVFYPSRTLQLIGDDCYDPKGGGWAGKKIVFNNNWNYFFNADNDTIKIKTDAVLKEKWTLFQQPDILIAATVTKWDTATVMGVTDSIKTITLHVFDNTMKPISHELENATIALSKHYGLTKALNFTYFPTLKYRPAYSVTKDLELVGITNPNLGVQNLKWFDVFDFQVGDEFHYIESYNYLMFGGSASERKYIIHILKREDFKDSIRYTEDVQSSRRFKQNTQSDYVTTSEHYQDTNLIQKNIAFEQDPGVPVFNNDSSRIEIYPAFNTVSMPDAYSKNNGCWIRSIIIDDACNYVSYAKGRGLTSSSSGCWEWQSYDSKEQVYYKKGFVTWGTPLVLTNNEELNALFIINIYPNPTTDKIYIDLNDMTHCSFELFDAQGKSIIQKELNSAKNSVSIQELSKGMYLYRVKVDNKQIKIGKIIKD